MIAALFAFAGLLFLICLRKIYRKHYRRAFGYLLFAFFTAVISYYLQHISINLEDYSRIHQERDVAEVDLTAVATEQLAIIRDLVKGHVYRWQPKGSEIQLELRTLRFKDHCRVLGWSDYFRLSSLKSFVIENSRDSTVHSVQLQQDSRGYDIWKKARRLISKRPDLADNVKSCLEPELLSSEPQTLVAGRVYRFAFSGQKLAVRVVPGVARH